MSLLRIFIWCSKVWWSDNLSISLMNSKIVFFVSNSSGRLKCSPNCNKAVTSRGMSVFVKLRNHSSFVSRRGSTNFLLMLCGSMLIVMLEWIFLNPLPWLMVVINPLSSVEQLNSIGLILLRYSRFFNSCNQRNFLRCNSCCRLRWLPKEILYLIKIVRNTCVGMRLWRL